MDSASPMKMCAKAHDITPDFKVFLKNAFLFSASADKRILFYWGTGMQSSEM